MTALSMHVGSLVLPIVVIGSMLVGLARDTYADSAASTAGHITSRFQPTHCPFPLGEGQIEGRTVVCGFVNVPEERHRPGGRRIHLAVAVFKAQNPGSAPPLLFIGGGPGSAVLDAFAPNVHGSLARDLTGHRDLILFDQRGVGDSKPSLACQELLDLKYQQLGVHIGREEETTSTVRAALRCRDRLERTGINLDAYTTAAGAADVDDIRRALGYGTVDLWGLSYGTRLTLAVMETYPKSVHAAVLESALPPQIRHLVQRPGNAERAFRLLFDGCAADSACNAAYPNLEATFYQLVADLNVTPLRYQAQHPRTSAVHTIVLTGDGLVNSLFGALYHTDLIRYLPLAAASLRLGDTSLLSLAADRLLFDDGLSHGMNYSVQCAEEGNLTNPLQVGAAGRRVRAEIGAVFTQADFFRICRKWGAAHVSPSIKTPVVSAIPTLILAGEYDPITPPKFGRIAARTLRNSFVYEFPGVGHAVTNGSACAHKIMLQFLNDPAVQPDASCIRQMRPPAWVIPTALSE